MSDIFINQLSSSHANWLSVRQSLIAGNIANANTPGFKAQDVKALDLVTNQFSNLIQTNERHMSRSSNNAAGITVQNSKSVEIFHSGGNVSLPMEMMKASEVATSFQLNTSVMKSFHRMVIAAFGT